MQITIKDNGTMVQNSYGDWFPLWQIIFDQSQYEDIETKYQLSCAEVQQIEEFYRQNADLIDIEIAENLEIATA